MRSSAHDLFWQAADAADEILSDVYKVEVRKSLDPLKHKDFEKIVAKLGHDLAKYAVPVEDAALKKAVGKLDVDWNKMNAEARSKVIQEAQKYLGAPFAQAVLPKIDQQLSFFTSDFVEKVKKNTVHAYDLGISPNLSATDERIAKFARISQGHFIRDELGERQETFSLLARHLVADGMEKGLGSAEISEKLASTLTMAKRGPGYWTMIAMVFANRARTSVQLFSYAEAGIEYYLWESVLDEATSMQCRFMHGRRFGVAGAVKDIRGVEESDDPEAVVKMNPFLNHSKDELYYKGPDGKRVNVATVTENVVGQKDKIGSFSNAMSHGDLTDAGVRMPPVHGHCRSTVIPDVSPAIPQKPVPAAPVPGAPVPQQTKPHGESKENKDKALAALDKTSQDGIAYLSDVFPKDGLAMQPYTHMGPPTFLDAQFEALKVSKKPKLDELVPTQFTADAKQIETYIKSSKALDAAPKPVVVKMNGELYVHSGHEVLAAQKLLGQKVAYADVVDLDKHKLPPPPAVPPPAPSPIAHPLGIHDPKKSVVWGKAPEHDGVDLNGVKLEAAPASASLWKQIPDVDVGEPHPPALAPGQKRSSGVVIVEDDGRVWIVEPKNHFGGYENTFPKGKIDPGLSHQQNAMKEAHEETGLLVEIKGYLGDFEGQTSNTRYYIGKRVGGAPWAAHWESDAVKLVPPDEAAKLLNTERDKKILAALKDYQNAPPPAPHVIVPRMPAPPPKPPPLSSALGDTKPAPKADVILGTKIGSAQGSNEGGFYAGKDGVKRYVKFYKDKAQAPGEHLANMLYKALGHAAPESVVFEHEGKTCFASEIVEGVETLGKKGLTKDRAKLAMEGFVVDVLTANWDAAGLSLDNMVVAPDGRLIRIDNGGSFLMRASSGRKADAALNTIADWDKLLDPSVNASYAKLFKAAGYDDVRDMKKHVLSQIAGISDLRDQHGGWAGFVEKHAPMLPAADKKKIVGMLDARTNLLEAKAVELKKPAPPPPKKLPKGEPIAPEKGRAKQPPKPDLDNLYVRKFENLPKRSIAPEFDTPPTGEEVAAYRAKAEKSMASLAKADPEAHRAIQAFTGSSYSSIRKLIVKAQQAGDTTSAAGKMAVAIERAFERGKGFVPGQTFRGLRSLPKATIDQLMVQDEIDLKGIASTSRAVRVARDSFMGGTTGSDYRAFLIVHQKRGLPVETSSSHGHEYEILTSGRARYRVLNRHIAEENPNTLVMEIEEL